MGQGESKMESLQYKTSVPNSPEHNEAQSTQKIMGWALAVVYNKLQTPLLLGVGFLFFTWWFLKKPYLHLSHIFKWCRRGFSKKDCSVAPEVGLLEYYAREWKGDTNQAKQMRKAYKEIYQTYHIQFVRRVRGDNYCALRATMFQIFSHGINFPSWMKEVDIVKIPEKLMYSHGCNWIQQYSFGSEKYAGPKAFRKLRNCMEILKSQWTDIYAVKDQDKRLEACEILFSDEDKEYKIYEAVKFLMLYLVIEFYEEMKNGRGPPNFCNFLFARDTSLDPLSFMMNHLNTVGDTGGLEQIEMFLLGYTLEVKIKVLRLYKFSTEEFEAHYPEEYQRDWHEIILLTEDDRHYNVPVSGR
ncbi:inactive ubiquitin thioesterase OTULINL [Latimeria chalumnae]|uniref:inactive ubiquitin thioesterase OTULINL n=1 Tax=Latimeria chalumnae TaxID=7897 RepID=UPI00313E2EC5